MDPDRWQHLWSLFHRALERPEGPERAAFLVAACGEDVELRGELDGLLGAHAEGTLGEVGVGADRGVAAEVPEGSRIGAYVVVRKLGEGGMGQVYEALQEAPVRRRVALKLIKLGLDTHEVVRRFEAERQVLARMDHSGIARAYDAGSTPEGRPYFAMELVDGPALGAFCDARGLAVCERVRLLAEVCRAVHSAHQRGIIHRDLKLSNVLVASEAGRALPKVIDFGIARAVDRSPGEGTLVTRWGQLVGTPDTMSPEQAAMSLDLDTRTDVYSLGAMLYELLTGLPPLRVAGTPFPELLRRIRETEPLPPSARFLADEEAAGERAALRGSDPVRLRRELLGELDWIAARAMAKERERRYGSALELAQDLERFLALQPVAAGPPSALYRLRKLLRRHRAEAAAAAILLIALVAFSVTMAVQSRRLASALAGEERERRTAGRVSELLVEILEQPDPAVARGGDVTVRQVLDRGAERIARDLGEEPEIQGRLLATIGHVFLNLGAFEQAAAPLERALELARQAHGEEHPEVATALHRMGELEFERGRYEPSRGFAERALAMRRRTLSADDPAIADSLDLLAVIERQRGELATATRLHQDSLALKRVAFGSSDPAVADSHNYLGIVRRWSGDFAGAESEYRQALAIWRAAHGEDHPKVAMALNNLALAVHVRGDHREAKRLFGELLPLRHRLLGGEHPDYQLTLTNYGKLLHDMGDLAAAEATYREALEIGERAVGSDHPQIATTLADFAGVLAKLGKLDEARAAAERSLAIRRRAFGERHSLVATSLGYLGEVAEASGDRAAAERYFEQAHAMLREVAGAERPVTAQAAETLGLFRLRGGDAAGALPLLEAAVAALRAALPADDRRIGRAESSLGAALAALGRSAEAVALFEAKLEPFDTPETRLARQRLAAVRR